MAYSSSYADGTATVTAGGTVVTGTGTAWVSAKILPGALLFAAGLSLPLPIRSVTAEGSLVLDVAAPSAITEAAYRIVSPLGSGALADLMARTLQLQARAFDLDGPDKTLALASDDGEMWTAFGTETTPQDLWRFGVGVDHDTFRFQRWTGTAWASCFAVDRTTGVTTFDGSPEIEATYLEGLVAQSEAARDDAVAAHDGAVSAVDQAVSDVTASTTSMLNAAVASATAASAASATAAAASATAASTRVTELTALEAALLSAVASAASNGVTASPWWLDGLDPSVILSAPSGVKKINGAYAGDISSLLTISSVSKRVTGPTGTLDTIAANSPAWDWSSGRRRLLIEAKAATKYGPYSEAVGGTGWSLVGATRGATTLGPDGTAGLSALVEDTSTGAHYAYGSGATISASASGEHWSTRWLIKAAVGGRNVVIALLGAAVSASIVVNPTTGAVVATAGSPGLARVTARAGGYWLVEMTAATTASGAIYSAAYLASGTATSYTGDGTSSVYVGYVNSEKVANADDPPSSYVTIPGTAAVTRTADDVRLSAAALAQLTGAAGATLVVRGDMLMGAATARAIFAMWGTTDAESAVISRNVTGNQLVFGAKHLGVTQNTHVIPDTAASIGVCAAFGPSGVRLSSKGSAATTVAWTSGAPTMASILTARLGDRYGSNMSANMLIDEIVIWPFVGSTAAVQSQARVWA